MKDERHGVKPEAAVRPLFITKQNAESATGENFRFWKSNYPHLVRRVGRKAVIVAAELERAVAEYEKETKVVSIQPADPAEAVRLILRRAGER
jgi:hypothetical protein